MKGIGFFLLMILSHVALAGEPQGGFPRSMTVITSNARPVVNAELVRIAFAVRGKEAQFQVHNLDDVDALEAELSEGLPGNEALAQQLFDMKVNKIGQKALEQKMMDAYQGVILAMRHGIQRYPAIVFDERYVVVGVNDLNFALKTYQSFTEKAQSYAH